MGDSIQYGLDLWDSCTVAYESEKSYQLMGVVRLVWCRLRSPYSSRLVWCFVKRCEKDRRARNSTGWRSSSHYWSDSASGTAAIRMSSSSRSALPAPDTGVLSGKLLAVVHKEISYEGPSSESEIEGSGSGPRKRQRLSPAHTQYPNASQPISRISRLQGESTRRIQNGNGVSPNVDSNPTLGFTALNVDPWLVASLGAMAITAPTAIQRGCIPQILEGKDCIGGSRTGSGKTVAFAVPLLQKWAEDPIGIFAVILTPTRYVFLAL